MKKVLSILIAIVLMLGAVAPAVYAASGTVIQPYYIGAKEAVPSIKITSGTAECYGRVSTRNPSYKVSLTVSLQRLDSSWVNVHSWSTSGTYNVSLTKYATVTSGKYYRVKLEASVYDGGNLLETFEEYSGMLYCS